MGRSGEDGDEFCGVVVRKGRGKKGQKRGGRKRFGGVCLSGEARPDVA
jgi:hypothetical protein